MTSVGIRELRDHFSRHVRRVGAGTRIAVTAHGRVVAELHPPATAGHDGRLRPYDRLVATGIVRPPMEGGDPLAGWPTLRLPAGTVSRLIQSDRGPA